MIGQVIVDEASNKKKCLDWIEAEESKISQVTVSHHAASVNNFRRSVILVQMLYRDQCIVRYFPSLIVTQMPCMYRQFAILWFIVQRLSMNIYSAKKL